MIPKKVKKEKPIKPKSDIDSFINNELKNSTCSKAESASDSWSRIRKDKAEFKRINE